MIMESAIDSIARLMIERHGEQASFKAAVRARVLENCNDRQTSRTWSLISRRIDEIAPRIWTNDFGLRPEPIDWIDAPSIDVNVDADHGAGSDDSPELVTVD